MKQLHRILLPFAVVAAALSMAACASQGDLATAQAELTAATQRVATLEEQFTEAQAATAKGTIKLKPPTIQDKPPDESLAAPGFTLRIVSGGTSGDILTKNWETVTGGSLNIEVADASTGADGFREITRGRQYVEEISLRGPVTTQSGSEGTYEILENGAGKFRVEIGDLPTASANVESVTMEDLVIDERELSTGAVGDYRVYGPGDVHFGSITIRTRLGRDSTELYQWWLDASQGKDIRKSISVIALTRDGSEARRYDWNDCFPTKYQPIVLDGSSSVMVEEITVQCNGVTLTATGARKAIMDWLNNTVMGQPGTRTVTLKEIMKDGSAGKTFTYLDCFPTRYVFPAFSASAKDNLFQELKDILYEEITIKPARPGFQRALSDP